MREIKFRFQLKHKQDESIIFQIVSLTDYKNGLIKYPIDTNEWEILSCDEYINSKDKNNKEIYENDIVKVMYNYYGKKKFYITKVIWKYCGYQLEENNTKIIDNMILSIPSKLEVIGNVWKGYIIAGELNE